MTVQKPGLTIDELIENFELFGNWEDRYSYLIDLGRKLPELPEELKTDENKVQGCMSQVWLIANKTPTDPPLLEFRADSDAAIVRGLIAIVLVVYSGRTPHEIVGADITEVFSQLGLDKHLSPNRRNGFFAMVERIKSIAKNHLEN